MNSVPTQSQYQYLAKIEEKHATGKFKSIKTSMKWLYLSWLREKHQWQLFNQSRMCGKEDGLGLFPSDSLESQSHDFDETAHIKH